jgi:hypothetical protein
MTEISGNEKADRRVFCLTCIYGLGVLIGVALVVPAAAYLLIPPKSRKESQWVEAGEISQLEPNKPEEMSFRRIRVDGWKTTSEKATAWVVKRPDLPGAPTWAARTTGTHRRMSSCALAMVPYSLRMGRLSPALRRGPWTGMK